MSIALRRTKWDEKAAKHDAEIARQFGFTFGMYNGTEPNPLDEPLQDVARKWAKLPEEYRLALEKELG